MVSFGYNELIQHHVRWNDGIYYLIYFGDIDFGKQENVLILENVFSLPLKEIGVMLIVIKDWLHKSLCLCEKASHELYNGGHNILVHH